jgi:cysteine synthase
MSAIHDDITQAFGNTPLVRLNRLPADGSAEVLAKLEFYNPGASVKDRLGVAIVDAAEESGELTAGGTIVEGSSGNTGIALALVGAARGYRVVITMPETMSVERRAVVRAYGAEVVLTPGSEGMAGAVRRAEQIVEETPGAVLAHQFETAANAAIHRKTTAQEILRDTDGKVDVFVAGVGQVLKEQVPGVQIVAVEPADSPLLTEGKAGPHKIQGIGANFVPEVLDRDVIDEVFDVELADALRVGRDLASKEGIFAGISSGAIIHAALEIAARPENAGKRVVAIVCDTGERYLSTALYEGLTA